ncbi:MAG TPA: hypothetical protein VJT09_10400 [Pyrinomonadaceae bacterium]|nr:hypothetical protein [Pyrinomonadaceae bacterium]
MNNDEIQSAIEFLLKNQASFEVQLEKTNRQMEQTNQQIARTDEQLARTDEQLARTDAQLARTNEQLAQTDLRVSFLAETQTEFIQAMLGHVEAQREINADVRQMMRELAQARQSTQQETSGLAQAQQSTQQQISELAQVQQSTQRDISELTKIVGGLVKTVYGNGSSTQE